MKKLSTKIWLLILAFLAATVLFMLLFTDFLYEQLYVDDTEEMMLEVGQKLQTLYRGGKVTDELVAQVEDYNTYSNINVFAVRNPKELSACVPFDIDYDTLIGAEERQQLLAGKPVTKIGYEERFERQIISVILPMTDQNRLEGILYVYYPLAKISELAKEEVILLLTGAVMFLLVAAFFVYYSMRKILQPLEQLQHAAEKISDGDYAVRVAVQSQDEIGKLSHAFNKMATAIQKEDEAQKTFLATVSHELRTPISYVKGYSEAIQNGSLPKEAQDETIALITREAGRMERLTNELLQLARKEIVTCEELDPIIVAETLREVMSLLAQQAQEKHITFTSKLDEDLIVLANEEKLKQVCINIIENAIRYSDADAPIEIEVEQVNKQAILRVKDSGIGIPPEDLAHITERFYRVNKARSRADGGSGLGLSIVEQFVKQFGGTLTITSTLGEGTHVVVTLPLMEELE
ncbi:MAG: HAMP domain-containing sensor histidine kinase [Solibacillus sp.]